MNLELLAQILAVAVASGIICTQATQFIKELGLMNKCIFRVASIIFSFGMGYCFAYSFTNLTIEYRLWIAVLSIIGAEAIYKSFEGKFGLKPLSEIAIIEKNKIEENEIPR